ncbi:hypothetical protein TSOC_008927 [Tetrabaena socialis]|uniref:Uncharacterized protein n=1 Tax=Tetrabaena socialis TaxID=47790 RepID=A0A2J7ZX35_9CHLO|nr:hypothetical protein TSOC_008927 [Tetrabaena socialis]|eukprot:PNH04818.1 hypothetical protein TSOC_008927 [Tetrabaena socialis]
MAPRRLAASRRSSRSSGNSGSSLLLGPRSSRSRSRVMRRQARSRSSARSKRRRRRRRPQSWPGQHPTTSTLAPRLTAAQQWRTWAWRMRTQASPRQPRRRCPSSKIRRRSRRRS